MRVTDEMLDFAEKTWNAAVASSMLRSAPTHELLRVAIEAALAASGSVVTTCLDSSLCECGREHPASGSEPEKRAYNISGDFRDSSTEPALPSREDIARAIHDSIQREAPNEWVGPCYDTADAVLALIKGKR